MICLPSVIFEQNSGYRKLLDSNVLNISNETEDSIDLGAKKSVSDNINENTKSDVTEVSIYRLEH